MKYHLPKIIKEKKVKKEFNIKFWKVFIIQGCLFLLTSIVAIVSAFELNKLVILKKVYLPATSWQDFLLYFILVTFFILFLVSYKKAGEFKELIYKGIFIVTVFCGGMAVLNIFLPVFVALVIIGILIMAWLEFSTIWVHDILMVLGLAGASSFLGLSFSPSFVVALLLVFSVYDFIAIYKTKHMVLMAKEMIEKKVVLGFIIPKEIIYFKEKLKQIKIGGNFMILGGGDVVFPNLLAVSLIPSGIVKSFIVVLFSLAGSLFSYWLFSNQENKEPIPALPPIALFAIVGYFITLLI